MIFGLGGTQHLSLPMMIALRRFTILMVMVLEFYILEYKPKLSVQIAVYMMVIGAIIAALNDLAFNLKVSKLNFLTRREKIILCIIGLHIHLLEQCLHCC